MTLRADHTDVYLCWNQTWAIAHREGPVSFGPTYGSLCTNASCSPSRPSSSRTLKTGSAFRPCPRTRTSIMLNGGATDCPSLSVRFQKQQRLHRYSPKLPAPGAIRASTVILHHASAALQRGHLQAVIATVIRTPGFLCLAVPGFSSHVLVRPGRSDSISENPSRSPRRPRGPLVPLDVDQHVASTLSPPPRG